VARTRLIDDLVTTVAPTVAQVVVLGAGFDTRAHRLDALRATAVFEVDHPATQARKRALVPRSSVRYVPVDLATDDLDPELDAAGFDAWLPTLVVWEGVSNYLDEASVDATLRWCGKLSAGSHLVFTYVDDAVLSDPGRFHRADRVLASSRRAGEPVTFGMAPAAVPAYLADRGLTLLDDVGAADYRVAHYGPAALRIRGHEFYRVASCVRSA
jgi:methyltransferase (TIGR00027 family)